MSGRQSKPDLCGLIIVDKPVGLSSMDVVRRVRRAAGGVKTGHAGTLDPLASGVVICCLGRATKSVESLMGLPKTYETDIDLTAFTTTDDREGERLEVCVDTPPSLESIQQLCQRYIGEIQQAPPIYSAIHINGRRAYKMARKGEQVEMPSRTVRIDAIDILSYDWPILSLRVSCGRGTYIRSLGRDLGRDLGTGGHLASLRRTAVGDYTLSDAHPIDRFDSPITQDDLLPVAL